MTEACVAITEQCYIFALEISDFFTRKAVLLFSLVESLVAR